MSFSVMFTAKLVNFIVFWVSHIFLLIHPSLTGHLSHSDYFRKFEKRVDGEGPCKADSHFMKRDLITINWTFNHT